MTISHTSRDWPPDCCRCWWSASRVRAAADPLRRWNDGPAKSRIVGFVQAVTDTSGKDYVPPSDRIAVFDNDGTLWSEQPAYFQLLFAIDRVRALAPRNPRWKTQQPFKAAIEGDMKALAATGEKGLLQLVMVSHAGMTSDEFTRIAKDWLGDGEAPEAQPAVHRPRVPADAGGARLPARERVPDLHRVRRRHRVRAGVLRAELRHSAGAGDRLQHQDALRSPRRPAGDRPAAGDRLHRRQGRQAGRHPEVHRQAARSRCSATRTATSRCSSGRRRATVRGWA